VKHQPFLPIRVKSAPKITSPDAMDKESHHG
jgi:hypothetical protein